MYNFSNTEDAIISPSRLIIIDFDMIETVVIYNDFFKKNIYKFHNHVLN